MKIKHTILMLTTALVLLFLGSNISTIKAETSAWQVGDLYTFSNQDKLKLRLTDQEYNLVSDYENNFQQAITLNITGIDLLLGQYKYISTDFFGSSTVQSNHFRMEKYISDYLDLFSLLTIDYEWNYETNETILIGFNFNFPFWFLIEPDWLAANNAMEDIFNESQIIYQVPNPYLPIIYNITLGDFLNDISYSFMGKSTLTEAKELLKSTTRRWEISFDLSQKIHYAVFNGTLGYNVYYVYDEYTVSSRLSYGKGGVLDRSSYQIKFKVTDENNLMVNYLIDSIIVNGDLKALTANFPYYIVIPGIASILLIARIARRKSKEVKGD